jgi:hypothetical protein
MYLIGISFNCLKSVSEVKAKKTKQKLNFLTSSGAFWLQLVVTNTLHYSLRADLPFCWSAASCL